MFLHNYLLACEISTVKTKTLKLFMSPFSLIKNNQIITLLFVIQMTCNDTSQFRYLNHQVSVI